MPPYKPSPREEFGEWIIRFYKRHNDKTLDERKARLIRLNIAENHVNSLLLYDNALCMEATEGAPEEDAQAHSSALMDVWEVIAKITRESGFPLSLESISQYVEQTLPSIVGLSEDKVLLLFVEIRLHDETDPLELCDDQSKVKGFLFDIGMETYSKKMSEDEIVAMLMGIRSQPATQSLLRLAKRILPSSLSEARTLEMPSSSQAWPGNQPSPLPHSQGTFHFDYPANTSQSHSSGQTQKTSDFRFIHHPVVSQQQQRHDNSISRQTVPLSVASRPVSTQARSNEAGSTHTCRSSDTHRSTPDTAAVPRVRSPPVPTSRAESPNARTTPSIQSLLN
ncbi:hypothetical protein NliqN6_3950 [Naganishia liquefaciens]|uniref:Uncharacterized protein n=1 Tax=Naganishia liquefaciens TaxID=104408 RepID=A0A8H3YFR5_9TREE|nr:hypothetical protein NliqN6_3950 [Naganishia liquefaciens]